MNKEMLLTPLRLVLNTACNGKCYFCHHEGTTATCGDMPLSVVSECIDAARQLKIPKISLTGGEPTLREDLGEIIDIIKERIPTVDLGITTNGFGIDRLAHYTLERLDHISLSITSFQEALIYRYQCVDAESVLELLRPFAFKTTINVVVVDDNRDELISIIEKCFDYGFSVDLMFELISDDLILQAEVLSALTQNYGLFSIHYFSTPVMMQSTNTRRPLRIKSPSISSILCRRICKGCPQILACPERVCALRVYPDGSVTPCLNGYIRSRDQSTYKQILDLYPRLRVDLDDLYSFVINR